MEFFALVKEATKHDNPSWLPAHSQNPVQVKHDRVSTQRQSGFSEKAKVTANASECF
jgi:hypothetical protein